MQYILTQKEMNDLKCRGKGALERANATIQKLCTQVSDMSVGKIEHHAGCILNPDTGKGGYCDECPVTDDCPYEHKNWSK